MLNIRKYSFLCRALKSNKTLNIIPQQLDVSANWGKMNLRTCNICVVKGLGLKWGGWRRQKNHAGSEINMKYQMGVHCSSDRGGGSARIKYNMHSLNQGFSYLSILGSRGRLIWEKWLANIQNWENWTV